MAQSIGIRYTSCGIRALGLNKSDDGLRITGISAGYPREGLRSFLEAQGFSLNECVIAIGLSPGNFLSAAVTRTEEMNDETMREQLRWEIERKMISSPSTYNVNYTKNKVLGFAFAGRRELINDIQESIGKVITDVEPVALYNGCISANEVTSPSVILISVEAEGISSVILHEGSIIAMESIPIREDILSDVVSVLQREEMESISPEVSERLIGYTLESIERMKPLYTGAGNIAPEHIILAGGGAYLGYVAGELEHRSGIPTTISNPFASFKDEEMPHDTDFRDMGAAFTTCFGLAVRALTRE